MKCTIAMMPMFITISSAFIVGCGERVEYYNPSDPVVVSNRMTACGLVQIMGPKIRERVKSYNQIGRYDVAWEVEQLFENDVRSKLCELVDLQLLQVKSNQFTKAGVDYLKAVATDSRVPGTASNFAMFEYKSILTKIEDCIKTCRYSEAQEWDRYLQKVINNNRECCKAMADAITYYTPNDTNALMLAYSIAGEPYHSKRMCPSMTLGQILNNPDELLRRRVDNFQKNGLSLEVVVCYYSENRPDELKRLFDWFLPVDLELDGSLKGKIVKYRDDGWYVNNDGKFSVLNNTVENTMAKDLKRLYSTFQTTDDIARFMVHLYYEFHYVSDEELKRKFTERYEFLMNDLQNLCVEGRKIDSTRAFKRIEDFERAERKARAMQKGKR